MDHSASISSESGIEPAPHWLAARVISLAMPNPPAETDRVRYMRSVRDMAMAATDWTQASDSPLSPQDREEWAEYRQALRDLPSIYGGDGSIPWPARPE